MILECVLTDDLFFAVAMGAMLFGMAITSATFLIFNNRPPKNREEKRKPIIYLREMLKDREFVEFLANDVGNDVLIVDNEVIHGDSITDDRKAIQILMDKDRFVGGDCFVGNTVDGMRDGKPVDCDEFIRSMDREQRAKNL